MLPRVETGETPFLLYHPRNRLEAILNRAAVLVDLLGRVAREESFPDDVRDGGREAQERVVSLGEAERRVLVSDTRVQIVIRLLGVAIEKLEGPSAAEVLSHLVRILEDSGPKAGLTVGQRIPVARCDVDPLIMRVSPPTYTFPTAPASTAYDLQLFGIVAEHALSRIEITWPEVGSVISDYVRLLIHVPEADFRSCSADRYSGVVFLTASDETIIEIEESLVHEFAHQILYDLMELDPLVADESDGLHRLPWSNTYRDLYGIFHAYYVYTLLARYYSYVLDRFDPTLRSSDDLSHARRRRLDILAGLVEARDATFRPSERRFTELGQKALQAISGEIELLTEIAPAAVSLESREAAAASQDILIE